MIAIAKERTKKREVTKQHRVDTSRFLALDTETTGLTLHHGCRGFTVSACNQDGETFFWDTPVNPKNRMVIWSKQALRQIKDTVDDYSHLFFFHASFDIQVLKYMDEELYEIIQSKEIHDTQLLAHIYDSKGPRGLKEIALLHLDITDDDEKALDEAIKKIHRKLKNVKGWDIAREGHPHFPGATGKFFKMDFWLPKAYAQSKLFTGTPEEKEFYLSANEIYATKDAIRTAGLAHIFADFINGDEASWKAYEIQREVINPVIAMESNGLHLLPGNFERELEEYQVQADGFKTSLRRMVSNRTFNPESNPQLQTALFDYFKYPTDGLKETATGYSTDKDSLHELVARKDAVTFQAYRFVKTLQNYKATNSALKYLKSYRRFQKDHHLYPSLYQCGTSTTRLSSREPNGQNVGKGKENKEILDENGNPIIEYSLRRVFGPEKGRVWYTIDYDQLQIRIFAWVSREQALIKAITEGKDFHTFVAQDLYATKEPSKEQRKKAKAVNFAIIFGAGRNKITAITGDPTAFDRYKEMYPNVADYMAEVATIVRKYGFVRTASGYPLTVAKNKPYTGVNYIVQGTEGDIVKLALGRCYRFLSENHPEVRMLLQVHDEIIFDCPEGYDFPLQELCTIMEDCGTYFGIPCKAKPEIIKTNWAESMKCFPAQLSS